MYAFGTVRVLIPLEMELSHMTWVFVLCKKIRVAILTLPHLHANQLPTEKNSNTKNDFVPRERGQFQICSRFLCLFKKNK